MDISSTRIVPAPPAVVWDALNDPDVLKDCLPGCESIEKLGEHEWKVTMAARVGPVAARFTGRMAMSEVVAPTSYTLSFDGQGGAAGFAKGEARVSLAPSGADETALTYVAKAQIGGKLAQIGSRLVDGVAAKMTDDFFTRFVRRLRPAAGAEVSVAEAGAGKAPGGGPAGGTPWIRYAAIAAIIVVLIVLYLHARA
ncbi:MAG TPA: carbon monoxide dehydrogenase subunit G [Casimicrobiaceae bacterium]|nr:carbon monoxide dehydrogenase subunit G [Casimicrobiaceae bacterium]